MDPRTVERVWAGGTAGARVARALLAPAGWLFGAIGATRGALYDHGILPSREPALPAVSIGNLTVGGTGKTPIAAEAARRLLARGARPAVVLRGYGDDEPLVHAHLNPTVPVVVSPDRLAGAERARAAGATVCILDDAFQHRRARRRADVVLISADAWRPGPRRALPAGPWREPLSALRRASLALVTTKAAAPDAVAAVRRAVAGAAPRLPIAVASLAPGPLRQVAGDGERPLASLAGRAVVAVAGIGDPRAFLRQLERAGAVPEPFVFADHHPYGPDDVARIAGAAERVGLVVCTLKDAVKLAPRWPRAAAPLWYVSQAVRFEEGEAAFDALLDRLLADRPHHS